LVRALRLRVDERPISKLTDDTNVPPARVRSRFRNKIIPCQQHNIEPARLIINGHGSSRSDHSQSALLPILTVCFRQPRCHWRQ
jgi:hypothetical protein